MLGKRNTHQIQDIEANHLLRIRKFPLTFSIFFVAELTQCGSFCVFFRRERKSTKVSNNL